MKFDGLEPRRCEDIKEIVAPEINPKSFGTFEKQAPSPLDPEIPRLKSLFGTEIGLGRSSS